MGLCLPNGEFLVFFKGKWESMMLSDGETVESLRKENEKYFHFEPGTKAKYNYRGRVIEFEL